MAQDGSLMSALDEIVAKANAETTRAALRETGEPPADVMRRLRELRRAIAEACPERLPALYKALCREAAQWLADDSVSDDFKLIEKGVLERNREAFEALAEL